jgi:alkanesulfonate monooxygenase SsuD/methylene tetrahydromethanopterin reductase-like flavin-dependent oxidoreductase (luciferase family)
VEEAELIKPVLDVGLAKRLPEDEQRFASVQTKYRELVQAIEQIGFKSPYCPENAEIPEDSPAACKQ